MGYMAILLQYTQSCIPSTYKGEYRLGALAPRVSARVDSGGCVGDVEVFSFEQCWLWWSRRIYISIGA